MKKTLAALALVGGLAGFVRAEAVTVSSSTVTTIMAGGSTNGFVLANNGGQTVYVSNKVATATVAAGLPVSSGTVLNVENYLGGVYGTAAVGSSGVDVRVFRKVRS